MNVTSMKQKIQNNMAKGNHAAWRYATLDNSLLLPYMRPTKRLGAIYGAIDRCYMKLYVDSSDKTRQRCCATIRPMLAEVAAVGEAYITHLNASHAQGLYSDRLEVLYRRTVVRRFSSLVATIRSIQNILEHSGDEVVATLENWSLRNSADMPWLTDHAEDVGYMGVMCMLTHTLHDPRPSESNPTLIAYYQTAEKRSRGVRTPIKVGRYLTKYFPHMPSEKIREYATKYEAMRQPATLHFLDLTTEDNWDTLRRQWQTVYRYGPPSCMGNKSSTTILRAVGIYAYPGNSLRLVYSTTDNKPWNFDDYAANIDAKREIISRCIVREDNKEWIRVYPESDGPLWKKIKGTLEALGYTHGNLDDVQIDLIETGDGRVACPYIDYGRHGSQTVSIEYDRERQRGYLLVGGGDMEADQTSGYAAHTGNECSDCGCHVHDEDTCVAECGDSYCESCYDNRFVQAYARRDYEEECLREDCIEVSGNWYHTSYLARHDIYQCPECDEYFHIDDMVSTKDDNVCNGCAVELDVPDGDGNGYASSDDVVTTTDGRAIREDESVEIERGSTTYVLHNNDDPDEYIEIEDEDETEQPEQLAA